MVNIKNINDIIEILQKDVINEKLPIKTVILIIIGGRKCKNFHPMSKNLMINDEGGIGKDFLMTTIMKSTDTENWFLQKSPTPAAVTISQRPDSNGNIKKPITRDTIVYIEDATPRFTDDNPHFKLLLDDDVNDYPIVDKMKCFLVNWKKPVVIITCAESSSNKQFSRRLPQLSMDSSKKQTQAISRRKRLIETGKHKGISTEERQAIRSFIKSLKHYEVVISDEVADKIEKDFLSNNYDKIFLRTLENRIYDYIKFNAVIHQKDRKVIDGKIIASMDDYDEIYDIIQKVYKIYPQVNNSLTQFNKRQKNIIYELKNNPGEQYSIERIFHLDCSGDVSKPTIYNDMRKIVREVKEIELFDTPLKNTPNYYSWSKVINGDDTKWEL